MGAKVAGSLTPKQASFVAEYLKDFCGKRAAVAAGFSARTAESQSSQLLKKPQVQAAIAERQQRRAERADISADRVLEEYRRIAFARIDGALSFGPNGVTVKNSADLTPELLAAVSEVSEVRNVDGSVSVRLKFHSKADALAALRRHLGLDAPEKVEVSVDDKLQGALGKLSGVVKRVATPSRG